MKRKGNLSVGIIKGISKAEKQWKAISNTTGSLCISSSFDKERRKAFKEYLEAKKREIK